MAEVGQETRHMEPLKCLRCPDSTLEPLLLSDIFYRCHKCDREYCLSGSLTFRWGHPLTVALYIAMFDATPDENVEDHAKHLLYLKDSAWLKNLVDEAELELKLNSQMLQHMHGHSSATEAQLRLYLSRLVDRLKREI